MNLYVHFFQPVYIRPDILLGMKKKSVAKKAVAKKAAAKKAAPKARRPAAAAAKADVTVSERMRVAVMRQIASVVRSQEWRQAEAAERCGILQPRMNDLLRGRVARFSLDALVNIAARLRLRPKVILEGI